MKFQGLIILLFRQQIAIIFTNSDSVSILFKYFIIFTSICLLIPQFFCLFSGSCGYVRWGLSSAFGDFKGYWQATSWFVFLSKHDFQLENEGTIAQFIAHYLVALPVGIGLTFGNKMGIFGIWLGLACTKNEKKKKNTKNK
jgi:hypothetical protein